MRCSVWEFLASTVILYSLDVPMMKVPRLGCDTEKENGTCFTSVAGFETRRVADAEGEETLRGYYAQVNMLPSVMLTGRAVRWVTAA